MPLSEDEQRILHEIERQFYEQDPDFARGVSSTSLYTHAGRNLKWAALGFLAGLVFMLFSFASSVWVGALGFAVMLGCALVFERNLRKLGRAGWRQVTQAMGGGGVRNFVGDLGRRMRERFRRDDN